MSSFVGYVGKGNLNEALTRLKHWTPDREGTTTFDEGAMGILELFKTKECPINPQPFALAHLTIVGDCRVDNREDLALELEIENINQVSDIVFIARAFAKWGVGCFEKLCGDFAVAIWDQTKKELTLARDPFGIKPLFYAIGSEGVYFSSEIKGVLGMGGVQKVFNPDFALEYFSGYSAAADATLYKGIQILEAHTYAVFKDGVCTNKKSYWSLGDQPPELPKTVKEQEAEFNRLFRKSVERRLRSYRTVAAEVSGGLDSTGIAAIAMEQLGKGANFYSFAYGKPVEDNQEDYKDDVALVREFCKANGIEDKLTVVNEQLIPMDEILQELPSILDQPDGNGVPTISAAYLKKAQEKDLGIILSGWGGDQMVTSTSGGFSESLANNKKWGALWKDVTRRHSFLKAVGVYLKYLLRSKKVSFKQQNLIKHRQMLQHGLINQETIKQYGLWDLPNLRYFLKKWDNIQDYQKCNIHFKGLMWRCVNHVLMGRHFRLDFRFPMFDKELLEYIHILPYETQSPKGQTRYLFKNLIKGKVPQEILDIHKSRNPTTPFGRVWKRKANNVLSKELNHLPLDLQNILKEDTDSETIIEKDKAIDVYLIKKHFS